ncbi:TPA: hypothetical protein ACH3X1_004870 [Trebouxia sp. C0004]
MLEDLLPAWELNRHQMVHLVAAIRSNGPCWAWAMFGFERFWKHLKDWVRQRTHVEAIMWSAHAAYKKSCLALPELAQELLAVEEDSISEGHSVQSVSTSFSHSLQTFHHATKQLILPSFLQASEGVAIDMTDSRGFVSFGFGQHQDPHRRRAELHLYYLHFPELAKGCACCGEYDTMWNRFVQE